MKKYRALIFAIALLLGFNLMMLIPTTRALFTDSILVANNNISTGSWPSPTPTPTPTITPTPTPTPAPTATPTPTPTATPTPTPTPNPNAADTRIDPASQTVAVGQDFPVNLIVSNAQDMGGFDVTIAYNPNNVEFVSPPALGQFLGSTDRMVIESGLTVDSVAGTITYGAFSMGPTPDGPYGEGSIATFTFRAKVAGQSNLNISDMEVIPRLGGIQPNGQLSGGTIIAQ